VRSKPFIVGFFAVVAVLAAASVYFSAKVDRADRALTASVAPDNKFKAVTIRISSGGAKPFCFNSVSVLLAVYPDEFALREKAYEVFAAPCGSFVNGEVAPKLEWLSGKALQITHKPAADAKAPRLKNIDVTKTVHVTFVERE
jgi:hypothetical protein